MFSIDDRECREREVTLSPPLRIVCVSHQTALKTKRSNGKTPDQVEADLMAIVPEPYLTRAHHWLILHGRYTCLARKPRCEVCLINDLCRWPEKTV